MSDLREILESCDTVLLDLLNKNECDPGVQSPYEPLEDPCEDLRNLHDHVKQVLKQLDEGAALNQINIEPEPEPRRVPGKLLGRIGELLKEPYEEWLAGRPWIVEEVIPVLMSAWDEIQQLREQRDDLQRRCNELLTQARGVRCQVDEFHEKFGHPRPREIVSEPDEELVRFRLRLIAEEFLEVMDAVFGPMGHERVKHRGDVARFENLQQAVQMVVEDSAADLDLPAFVDALADLDYVVEGTRIALGIDGRPIAAEVHRANMSKGANGPDGKPVKPDDWTPPDIEGELVKQGWKGEPVS